MILTTHAIVGASVAQFFPQQPLIGFALGVISHFCLDALPHKDYKLRSLIQTADHRNDRFVYNKNFVIDLMHIGSDFLFGCSLVLIFFATGASGLLAATVAGTIGGVLPDFLQFLYLVTKKEPFTTIKKFHAALQREVAYPWGIISQFAVVAIMVTLGLWLR